MSITFRIICGAAGLAILTVTGLLALNLLGMGRDASVFLAGYMAIGGILIGAYLLTYAITGSWRPNLAGRGTMRRR